MTICYRLRPPPQWSMIAPRPAIAGLVLAGLLGLAAPARAQEAEKFSLSMFHFNVQYVAGGLIGFPDGESNLVGMNLDDAQVQDRIITESFEPLLDLLLLHPSWKQTVELQGHMVEAMAERHGAILDKLKILVDAGQIELVSFHYSDQLFLAYPALDMVRSHELLDELLEEAGLTLSPVTFCQEGQFGEGMARLAPPHGQTILGLPKNLFRYQHNAAFSSTAPLYTLDGNDVVLIGQGYDASPLVVSWSFFDDGELWSTGDRAPYLGEDFVLDPESVARYEQELLDREAEGFKIASIEEYVAWVKTAGLPQPALPPILDGTWQPRSTDSMFRWMGKSGALDAVTECERDNLVITSNVRARHRILTAETLLAWARAEGLVEPGEHPRGLLPCWRPTLLGQVTDSTGINPFINEIRYGLGHAAQALACAEAILEDIALRVGEPWLEVDNATGAVTPMASRPEEAATPAAPLFTEADGFAVDARRRQVTVTWEALGSDGALTRVTISASAAEGGMRFMEVTFPFELDELRITPGLVEDEVRSYPLSAFDFEEGKIGIPLGNGLIALGEGRWLIKHTSHVHLAARLQMGEPLVRFTDETLDPNEPVTWVFYLFDGSDSEALAQANRLNTKPLDYVAGPTAPKEGCGCSAGGSLPIEALPWILLLCLIFARRRTSRPTSRDRL